MGELKFELVIAYYKRPVMVLNALESIKEQTYNNWHLTFIDDSGNDDFRETFMNYGFDKDKITYVPIMMSDQQKRMIGGSTFGSFINEAIKVNDCDVMVLICDDDALLPDYLENLNKYYSNNPTEMWSYCHVRYYNPEVQSYKDSYLDMTIPLNHQVHPINPSYRVDSSQVTFRKDAFIKGNVWWPFPKTVNLDADIFARMYAVHGACKFNGFYGQYKGWFDNQLGRRNLRGLGDFIN